MYTRDPLSVRFDPRARELIARAYANKGAWTGTYIPAPGPRARAWAAAHRIDLYDVDRWGELRFIRSFKRSVYWQVKWFGGLDGLRADRNLASGGRRSVWGAPVRVQWQTGRPKDAGDLLGAWAVRMIIRDRSAATAAAGRRARDPWIVNGVPTFRQSTLADRPWE